MDYFHKIHDFLSISDENRIIDEVCDLLKGAQKEIAGLWFLVRSQEKLLVSASEDVRVELEVERGLSEQLFKALSVMCTHRGIQPEDLEQICDALERYDRVRGQFLRDTYLKLEDQ